MYIYIYIKQNIYTKYVANLVKFANLHTYQLGAPPGPRSPADRFALDINMRSPGYTADRDDVKLDPVLLSEWRRWLWIILPHYLRWDSIYPLHLPSPFTLW